MIATPEFITVPAPVLQVGDYVASTVSGWAQGYIVKIHPPVTKFNIILLDVERPDGERFQLPAGDTRVMGGLSLSQLAWLYGTTQPD